MEIIDKKKFAKTVLDENVEAFVVYVISLNLIYSAQETQIALPLTKEIKILIEYLDFLDIFSKKKALELLEATELNQYAIKLQKS